MLIIKVWLERYALWAAFGVAWVATAGSLFFSEVWQLVPCTLCWYQRIAMYPLAILLLIAVVRQDHGVYRYALPLAIIGAVVALYHYLLQKTIWIRAVIPCTTASSCNALQINWLGFVTIPLMALVAFSIIVCLMWYIRKQHAH